jgi:hypothetical protein
MALALRIVQMISHSLFEESAKNALKVAYHVAIPLQQHALAVKQVMLSPMASAKTEMVAEAIKRMTHRQENVFQML